MGGRRPARSRAARLYAWLGGAAFAASIGYFVYFYVIVLGRSVHAPVEVWTVLRASAVDAALFGAFALHHSVMARTGAKRWLSAHIPATLERATYVWVASVLFFLTCAWWRPVPGELFHQTGPAAWVFWAAQGAGVWLMARSMAVLDLLELAGVRQVIGDSPAPAFREAGPYRLLRHPLYTGWILFVFATPHMTGSRLAFASISTAYVLMAIPWEERSLRETFGERYRDYTRRVRWRVIPYVY